MMKKLVLSLLFLSVGTVAVAESYGGRGAPFPSPRGGFGRQPFPGAGGGFGRPQFPRPCLPYIQQSINNLEGAVINFGRTVGRYEPQGPTERAIMAASWEVRRYRDYVAQTCDPRGARDGLYNVDRALINAEQVFRSGPISRVPEAGIAYQASINAFQGLKFAVNR